jgi:hypothetical protein
MKACGFSRIRENQILIALAQIGLKPKGFYYFFSYSAKALLLPFC